jgi:23S rRNA pseudouridine2457 synthase
MAGLILFNKPFQVLSQFTDSEGRSTLADFLDAPGFRVAGRLDYDSEGLLILTDDGVMQQRIANPASRTWKTYWVQVEGRPSPEALSTLRSGVALKDGQTRPARARLMETPPGLWPRRPAIRQRRDDITAWMELKISEGRNRQVRRMTAAAGFPTLRLIRTAVGNWTLGGLGVGEFRKEVVHMPLQPRRRR